MKVFIFFLLIMSIGCVDESPPDTSIDSRQQSQPVVEDQRTSTFVGNTDFKKLRETLGIPETYRGIHRDPDPYVRSSPAPNPLPVPAAIPVDERELLVEIRTFGSYYRDRLSYGNRIDLIGTFQTKSGPVTMTLLQNVPVLATYHHPDFADGCFLGVSVTVDEAELLSVAADFGLLKPLIRDSKNVEVLPIQKKTFSEISQEVALLQKKRHRATRDVKTPNDYRGVVLPLHSMPENAKPGDRFSLEGYFPKRDLGFTFVHGVVVDTIVRPPSSFYEATAVEVLLSTDEAEAYAMMEAEGAVFNLTTRGDAREDAPEAFYAAHLFDGTLYEEKPLPALTVPDSLHASITGDGLLKFHHDTIGTPSIRPSEPLHLYELVRHKNPPELETEISELTNRSERITKPDYYLLDPLGTSVAYPTDDERVFRLASKIAPASNVIVLTGSQVDSQKLRSLDLSLGELELMLKRRKKALRRGIDAFEDFWIPVNRPKESIRAGETVDLLGTFRYKPADRPVSPVIISLFQRVRVGEVIQDDAHISAIKLELTSEEIIALTHSIAVGATLGLIRRNKNDDEALPIQRKTLIEVLAELELIQKKRKVRSVKSRRPKRPQSITIMSMDKGGGPSGGQTYVPTQHLSVKSMSRTLQTHEDNRTPRPSSDPTSTFSIDVDTTSYSLAKSMLASYRTPHNIRTEEFINAFEYNYPEPAQDQPLAMYIDGSSSPLTDKPNTKLVRIALQAARSEKREPSHLTFLVDTSGSMSGEHRIGLAKKTLTNLAERMQTDDRISIVTFASAATVLLPPTGIENKGKIIDAIAQLETGGGTAMGAGIDAAYKLAAEHLDTNAQTRVVIASDGDTNIGARTPEELYAFIESYLEREIFLSIIGFGASNVNDETLETISNKGNGNYHFVGDDMDVEWLIKKTLHGTLETVAKDVKIQVRFDPKIVKTQRLVGYENRKLKNEDFANDAVDAGELGNGHSVTALYEIELHDGSDADSFGDVSVRYKPLESDVSKELVFPMKMASIDQTFAAAPDGFRFAAAIAAFAETIRDRTNEKKWDLGKIGDTLTEVSITKAEKQAMEVLKKFVGTR